MKKANVLAVVTMAAMCGGVLVTAIAKVRDAAAEILEVHALDGDPPG